MNMFARFDENPAMTLQDIKETKRNGRTDGQPENSIPTTNKVCGGIKKSKNVTTQHVNNVFAYQNNRKIPQCIV